MDESGLRELWIECDVLGANSAQHVMAGKGYARSLRTHKLTLQALWQVLLPRLNDHLDSVDVNLRTQIVSDGIPNDSETIAKIVNILRSERFNQAMTDFVKALKEEDPNYEFWWNYMEMVCILLYFIRAQRDGSWDLYLYAFRRMLPFFFRYDHINYARWGTVYLAEMAKVSNGAKIRNRYNQVPHLTQDTNGKVTNSQKTPQTRAKRSGLSQQVTTKHI